MAVGQTPVDGQVIRTFGQNYLSALERYSEGNCIVTDKLLRTFIFGADNGSCLRQKLSTS